MGHWYDTPLDLLDPGGTRHIFETEKADTSALTGALDNANAGEDAIERERRGLNPSTAQQAATRTQQQAQLPGLAAAARGEAPSAAQIGGQQAADAEAQRQFAMASALRRNPGAALQAGSTGTAAGTGAIGAEAAAARANEVAKARGVYTGATTGIRAGDMTAYQTAQAARDANMAAQLQQQAINAQIAKDTANANAVSAGATNSKRAGILSGGGALGASMLSDKRSKDAVRDKSMADALGKEVRGVTFEYKPGLGDGPGQHFGVLAQEIEKAIPGVVAEGGDGFKRVDTGHLTTANTALLSELARRVKALEGRR